MAIKARINKNRIDMLVNSDGVVLEFPRDIKNEIRKF